MLQFSRVLSLKNILTSQTNKEREKKHFSLRRRVELSLQIRNCVGLVSNYDEARREREGEHLSSSTKRVHCRWEGKK